jgi:hypothetical protein
LEDPIGKVGLLLWFAPLELGALEINNKLSWNFFWSLWVERVLLWDSNRLNITMRQTHTHTHTHMLEVRESHRFCQKKILFAFQRNNPFLHVSSWLLLEPEDCGDLVCTLTIDLLTVSHLPAHLFVPSTKEL